MRQTLRQNDGAEDGATILETLIAMTILFVGVTLALRLQFGLAERLDADTVRLAVNVADSLLVSLIDHNVLHDSSFTVTLGRKDLEVQAQVRVEDNMRTYRVEIGKAGGEPPVTTVYYEEPR